MVKQNFAAKIDFASFLMTGAIFQTSQDQFKLILGPFSTIGLSGMFDIQQTSVIYQPEFWDFLKPNQEKITGYVGAIEYDFHRDELIKLISDYLCEKSDLKFGLVQADWLNPDIQGFQEQFEWSQQHFKIKRLTKTVPIIKQSGKWFKEPSQALAICLFNALSGRFQGWVYGFWQDCSGYLGVTPELIGEFKENLFATAALAGTLPIEQKDELLHDLKNREEHNYVVQDIKEQLQKFISAQQILQSQTYPFALKYLVHLKTDFQCINIDFEMAFKMLMSLHPTAALGVYPRNLEMMEVFSMFNLQKTRSYFAAPFVFISQKSFIAVAAIRQIQFNMNSLEIFSGCGVTEKSFFEAELNELQNKRNSVKKMLGLSL